MKHQVSAQQLTIYIGESDQWKGGPLYAALVARLKESGIAGVTVLHGVEGFGSSGKLHTARFEVLFQQMPMVVQAVDIPERITVALAVLDEMLTEALVTVQDVQAIRYIKDPES